VISPARQAAFEALANIELRGAFSDFALNSPRFSSLSERDRHFTTELVYGVLRWQGFLDDILAKSSARPWKRVDPEARIALRMALYQLWRMDRVPDYASVGEAVELAKTRVGRSVSGFVNAILRNLQRTAPWKHVDSELPPWTRFSVPEWLWLRWQARWGPSVAAEFCLAQNEPPGKASWFIDRVPADIEAVRSSLVPGAWIGEPAADSRLFHVQDEASQLIPQLFGIITGWKVWDCCAAPGGKSALLQMLVGNTGFVASSEIHAGRAARMRGMLESVGCTPARVIVLDARDIPPFGVPFDAVLADVPCSGLGTLRRNPEIKWRVSPEHFTRLARVQGEILQSVSTAVRNGGLLLYSTCSTEPEEDEQVVDRFLQLNPSFNMVRPQGPPGVVELMDNRGFVRTFPSTKRWDGFFAALMVRRT
jgi:16S rRNA (cytosine967-C5)-methyltransferase